jgi:protein-ribulosamine 3-kinase
MGGETSLGEIGAALAAQCGDSVEPQPTARVRGGSIHECYRWASARGPLFVKIAERRNAPRLEAEAAGLEALAQARAIRVPKVVALGATPHRAYLALEWIDFDPGARRAGARLGEQLAQLHRCTAPSFGWHRDNTIGATPQHNGGCANWIEFFRERRLAYQLELAQQNGYRGTLARRGSQLLAQLGGLFQGYQPLASLLHGDLWGGNWGVDSHGQPVIFDPAVYYGDREADLAMTRLFGGFDAAFYHAYDNAWPLDAGAAARVSLYNLYHVLNHLNLFGGSYLHQAEVLIDTLLAEVRR